MFDIKEVTKVYQDGVISIKNNLPADLSAFVDDYNAEKIIVYAQSDKLNIKIIREKNGLVHIILNYKEDKICDGIIAEKAVNQAIKNAKGLVAYFENHISDYVS